MIRSCAGTILLVCVAAVVGCGGPGGPAVPISADGPPVAIRPENLVVLPATGPPTCVFVQNLRNTTYTGTLHVEYPEGWRLDATSKPLTIAPGQLASVPFKIDKGLDAESNSYPVRIRAVGAGQEVVWDRPVRAATVPYFKPVIDGKLEDWDDAVPVTFVTAGKKTAVSAYWSRKSFSLLVAVEEDRHTPMGVGTASFDAVQIAISPANAVTPTSASGKAQRYELLLAGSADGGKCFLLAQADQPLPAATQARPLAGLELADSQISVTREGSTTYYECAIPFKAMPKMRGEPGREFRFSLLVHDPDGTALRDFGAAVGLWPWQRNPLAWSRWQGAVWPEQPPFDNKIEWGFCSSKR